MRHLSLVTKVGALVLVTWVIVLLLAACTPPAGASDGNEPQNGVYVQWVDTHDGFEVQCLRLYDNGLSCDWDRKRYKP